MRSKCADDRSCMDRGKGNSGYTDNCGDCSYSYADNTAVSGTDCNWTVTYTYTVYDACLNPLGDQTYTHSGKDQTAPTASDPAPLTLQCFSQIPAPDPAVVIDEADVCGGLVSVVHFSDTNNGGSDRNKSIYFDTDIQGH